MWQLALPEVFEVQLFGREGQWICRAVVWMPPPAPDSLGGVLFPSRQPFIGSTGLLWTSKALPRKSSTILATQPCHPTLPLIRCHRGGNGLEGLESGSGIIIFYLHHSLHLGFLTTPLVISLRLNLTP